MEALLQDIRLTIRTLLQSPGFTTLTVVTLGLGIGANVAVYSVIDAVVLRPAPFPDAARLVGVQYADQASVSAARLDRLAALSRSYETLGAYTGWGFALTGDAESEHIDGARVTPSLFAVLRAPPALGRVFTEDEARRSGAVAVLSHGLWRSRFASDSAILGRTIMLDGRATAVIGVMPADFVFPSRGTQLWTPAPLNPADTSAYQAAMLTMVGRLARGATTGMASDELRRLRHVLRIEAGVMEPFDPAETRVVSLSDQLAGPWKDAMLLVAGIVGIVLLIACANVANLMLLRGITRQHGVAIRVALGASRGSLIRASLLESTAIALAGGFVGLGMALWIHGALARLLAADAPMIRGSGPNPLLLIVAFVITGVTAVVVGLAPALRAAREDAQTVLREGGRGDTARAWPRGALVISELALAFVLATAAGLMVKSLWKLEQVDPGFQAERVLSLRVSPPTSRYSDSARVLAYWRIALDRVRSLPGVIEAGAIHLTPMGPNNWNPDLIVYWAPAPRPGESRSVDWRVATPAYFRAMVIPLLRGRGFTEQDRYGTAAVAIVNRTLARTYFGFEDPIGKRVRTGFEGKGGWATIVGEVGDVHGHGLAADPVPEMYRPFGQFAVESMTLMIRGTGDPADLARSVRQALANVDAAVILDEVHPMREVVADSVAGSSRLTLLLLGFGALALTLAATGVFGVVSFAVAARTRELGIRVALGASGRSIMSLVLRQGLILTAIGLVVGSILALAVGGAVRSQLYQVAPHDPTIYFLAAATLVLVVVLATYVPARRATRVDAMIALRHE